MQHVTHQSAGLWHKRLWWGAEDLQGALQALVAARTATGRWWWRWRDNRWRDNAGSGGDGLRRLRWDPRLIGPLASSALHKAAMMLLLVALGPHTRLIRAVPMFGASNIHMKLI